MVEKVIGQRSGDDPQRSQDPQSQPPQEERRIGWVRWDGGWHGGRSAGIFAHRDRSPLGRGSLCIMTITPLGDQGVLATFDREADAFRFAAAMRSAALPGVIDVVAAYFNVAIFYDLAQIRHAALVADLERLYARSRKHPLSDPAQSHVIPCCYALGPDLARVAEFTHMSPADVIRLHSETEYTVYAIGFCPGFPYLGYLPDRLCGVPRLPSPRLRVEPGSVGLTGRQTGVYPLERPGGWNLIGRTPLQLVDVATGYFPLRPGDRVRFAPIDETEFGRLHGVRLGA